MARARAERTSEEWLAALRARGEGAARAQLELRELVAGALRKATSSFGPDEATLDDLTQTAVLRILEKLDRFEGRSRFTTWAYSVAVHAAFSELRRSAGARPAAIHHGFVETSSGSAEALVDEGADPTAPAEREEIVTLLHRLIEDQLTTRQREAVLSELRGSDPAEFESEPGTNRNALHKRLHDARKKLRQGLEAAGVSDADVRLAFDL